MAEKRMFTKKITDSDAFLNMPLSAQALYFHLNMAADDEGFVNNPKKIQRAIGASEDDLKLLMAKNFIITFESGVIVIKHWKMHNYIAKDRFHPTDYTDEKSMLEVKENGAYTMPAYNPYTECIQDVYRDKNRLDENSIDKNTPLYPPVKEWDEEKHTNVQNFEHLVETEMNEVKNTRLLETVKEWLMYKDGRKPKTSNHYQLQSIRSLTNKAFELAKKYGTEAVIKVISDSIANNYQGITWDRIEKNSQSKPKSTFNNIESRNEEADYFRGLIDNE